MGNRIEARGSICDNGRVMLVVFHIGECGTNLLGYMSFSRYTRGGNESVTGWCANGMLLECERMYGLVLGLLIYSG